MKSDGTFCELCGAPALARVHDVWVCASCGLEATRGGKPVVASGTRRMARRGIVASVMSAGILTKLMIGAVALAAAGAATIPLTQADDSGPNPDFSTTVATTTATTSEVGDGTDGGSPEPVVAYVDDVHQWTECIKAAVKEHVANRGDANAGFDPQGICGNAPKYVGRDGELPIQASDNARENRADNGTGTPGVPNDNASDKARPNDDATVEEAENPGKGSGSGKPSGNGNGDGNGQGKTKKP